MATRIPPGPGVRAIDAKARSDAEVTTVDIVNRGKLRWRPPYLRRRALAAFILLFLTLIAALEAIFALSQRPRGLAAARENLAVLWTLGPTTSKRVSRKSLGELN